MFRELEHKTPLFVIADVHGDYDAFVRAVEHAPKDALIVQLGDLVDRGPYSPLCAELMLELLDAKRAIFIAGNHDMALAEVVSGERAATPGRAETLEQFADFSSGLLEAFTDAVRAAPLCVRIGPFAFAHAAWLPSMETAGDWSVDLRRLVLTGERTSIPGARRPVPSYRWVDRIPQPRTAIVGHDARGDGAPLVCAGARGGRAVFLDLDCGRGGPLGCASITQGGVNVLTISPRRSDDDRPPAPRPVEAGRSKSR